MRIKVTFAAILAVPTLIGASAGADLADLYEAHEFFAYRDAVQSMARPPQIARGIVACVFNDLRHCEQYMRRVLSSGAAKEDQETAHAHLLALYLVLGRSRAALSEWNSLFKLEDLAVPSEDGNYGLLRAFAQFPEMSVSALHPSSLQYDQTLGGFHVPVLINGASGSYLLDSGAKYSMVSESEAKRVGMRLIDIQPAQGMGATGAPVAVTKVGLAKRVDLGRIRLQNVPFVVAPDATAPSRLQGGMLGIQVFLACQTIRWTNDGAVQLGYRRPGRQDRRLSNLSLDGLQVYVRAEFRGKKMDFQVDTGGASFLQEAFREAFPELVKESGRRDKWTISVWGAPYAELDATFLPEIELRLGQQRALLRPAPIISTPAALHFGLLARDAFQDAHAVTLDFRQMMLIVE
jgi:hypothetical protein